MLPQRSASAYLDAMLFKAALLFAGARQIVLTKPQAHTQAKLHMESAGWVCQSWAGEACTLWLKLTLGT